MYIEFPLCFTDIYDSVPKIPNAMGTNRPWPMLVMCKNQNEAEEIFQLQALIERIQGLSIEKQRDVVEKVMDHGYSNSEVLTRKRKVWPVASGKDKYSCIFCATW